MIAEAFASMAGASMAAAVAEAARPAFPRKPGSDAASRRVAPRLGGAMTKLPVIRIVGLRRERARRRAMDAEIPQLLDLLAAASLSGLAAPLALRRSVEALQGPLGVELGRALDRVDLGERWRVELAELAQRLALPDLRRAVVTLGRSATLGSSLAVACSDLAAEVRTARRARATERARTAPVKMLFPLVFLVLPAFLLLTVVPVLLATVQTLR